MDVIGGTLVSAIVGGLLAAAGISAAGIAIAAVTVGVMWAADVVYGYAQEARKRIKRVTGNFGLGLRYSKTVKRGR